MNLQPRTRLTYRIRHSKWLEDNHRLWNIVRPVYLRYLQLTSPRGLLRNINGVTPIRLLPELYGVSEAYEPQLWSLVLAEVQEGDVVADVGASLGLYTLAFAQKAGADGHIHAFEPDPETAITLRRQVSLNQLSQRVTVHEVVIGDHDGAVSFASGHGSESHVQHEAGANGGLPRELRRLDSVLPDRLDVLKIDTEGYELAVLRGATRLLTSPTGPRTLIIEVHPFAWKTFGVTGTELLQILWASDYGVEDEQGQPVEAIHAYGHIIARRQR